MSTATMGMEQMEKKGTAAGGVLHGLFVMAMVLVAAAVVTGVALGLFFWLVWPWLSVILDLEAVSSTGNGQWWGM